MVNRTLHRVKVSIKNMSRPKKIESGTQEKEAGEGGSAGSYSMRVVTRRA